MVHLSCFSVLATNLLSTILVVALCPFSFILQAIAFLSDFLARTFLSYVLDFSLRMAFEENQGILVIAMVNLIRASSFQRQDWLVQFSFWALVVRYHQTAFHLPQSSRSNCSCSSTWTHSLHFVPPWCCHRVCGFFAHLRLEFLCLHRHSQASSHDGKC